MDDTAMSAHVSLCSFPQERSKSEDFPASPWGPQGPAGVGTWSAELPENMCVQPQGNEHCVRSSNTAEPALRLLHMEPCSKSEVPRGMLMVAEASQFHGASVGLEG